MQEKEPKETIIKLEEHQFQHLSIILNIISRELKNIAEKQEKLETSIAKGEGEVNLILMKIRQLKANPPLLRKRRKNSPPNPKNNPKIPFFTPKGQGARLV